ncbi:uncharacterized protein B0P05DRAFT_585588 [Gilbertella persicaria]|uniref:Uncharacterized protein n=1 Tax=Rhizopus stolonifer TaxID=4846 RepID=A0A367JBJ3_RHIST|nr:uncharacterized protein B0P05DRAFT_585588 [Gilbertella persicaria]KAI8084296.1 hypothetical protein B0P05DRAFT_585588 [Gilbertella persicaria]RCH87255.1 hypothetical protein CU098_005916 [Rhizopus stolonifer]
MTCEDVHSWSPIFHMDSPDLFTETLLGQFDKTKLMLDSRFSVYTHDSHQEDETQSSLQDDGRLSKNPSTISIHNETIETNIEIKEQKALSTFAITAAIEAHSPLQADKKKKGLLHKPSTFFSEKVLRMKTSKVELSQIEVESELEMRRKSCPGFVIQASNVDPTPRKKSHWFKRLFSRD